MSSQQTTIAAADGGFSAVSLPIPAGTCVARLQPTLADGDWSAGQELTCSVDVYLAGAKAFSLDNWQLQTGSLQSDPSHPIPCYCQVASPADPQSGTRTSWPYDTAVFTVHCGNASVPVGAVVSFADDPANLPPPILPPGFVTATKI
jgi:hypothetical protein